MNSQKQAALAAPVIKAYTEELPSIPLVYRTNNAVVPITLKNMKLFGEPDETNQAELWDWH